LIPPPAVNRFFEKKSAMREKIKEKYQSPSGSKKLFKGRWKKERE